jgi:hypothetical protein
MGFYIRKSMKVGPLRFNLSKSGVGVSAGIKGARIGTGPRGNYIHLGTKGFYYRSTIPHSTSPNYKQTPTLQPSLNYTEPEMIDIESSNVTEMVDSSSADLLNEINTKRQRISLWPLVLSGFILSLLLLASIKTTPSWLTLAVFIMGVIGTIYFYKKDQFNKTIVLFYDFESALEESYKEFFEAFETLATCKGQWHISASGRVKDTKYHAGANQVISRSNILINFKEAPNIKTNIPVPAIPVGKQTLYLFPEHVLVFEREKVGAVSYEQLNLSVTHIRFVEEGTVPKDATVVDRTWKYVNKKGGPDKRFKNNFEIPVTLYDEIYMTSATGLNECIQLSRNGAGNEFQQAIHKLANVLRHREVSSTTSS